MSPIAHRPATLGLTLGSLAVVAGCQAGDTPLTVGDEQVDDAAAIDAAEVVEAPEPAAALGPVADGTYTAIGAYQSPNGAETVVVVLSVSDGVVVDARVDPQATNSTSSRYQGQFAGGIAEEVVGKPLADLEVSRVAGSSLTGRGFNDALEEIRAEAQGGGVSTPGGDS